VKPHDAGLVWLYFLFAGGVYRKRALQTLLATVVLGLPSLVWVWYTAPQWMMRMELELYRRSRRTAASADPGPASLGSHGLNMVVSLQAAISVFRDDPRIYNPVSYMVCAPLLLAWAFRCAAIPRVAFESLAGNRCSCGSFPAADLPSAIRHQASAFDSARLRDVMGRGRLDWVACSSW
jgi:hypothetical protein